MLAGLIYCSDKNGSVNLERSKKRAIRTSVVHSLKISRTHEHFETLKRYCVMCDRDKPSLPAGRIAGSYSQRRPSPSPNGGILAFRMMYSTFKFLRMISYCTRVL